LHIGTYFKPCILQRNFSVLQALKLMADRRNKIALPALATKYGFRLPPPEDCLIAPNFQFHPHNAPENLDWEEDPIPAGDACTYFGHRPSHPVITEVAA